MDVIIRWLAQPCFVADTAPSGDDPVQYLDLAARAWPGNAESFFDRI
jgi:hypothetical protein